MAELAAKSFEIDSTMDLSADGYTAQLLDSAAFLAAAATDVVKLSAGFTDPSTQISYTVGHVEGGIDEYTLTVEGGGITASVKGRDNLSKMLDRRYKNLFLRNQPSTPPTDPYEVGLFRASEIANKVVEAVGLSLSWSCRDYTILEDFDASGRPVDILMKLVEPWSQVEPFKVDIFIQGTTVFCRERPASFPADYTYNAKDARINKKTIRKITPWKAGTLYGKVTLYGRLVPKRGGVVVLPGEQPPDPPALPQPVIPWESEESRLSKTQDANGLVLTQVFTVTTLRMPDKLAIKVVERTFNRQGKGAGSLLKLISEKVTENEYERSRYDDRGPINRPKQLIQYVLSKGIHKSDKTKTFKEINKEETEFGYDSKGYQDLTYTRKWELNLKKQQLQETERVIKSLRDVEDLKVEQATSIYKAKGTDGEFYLSQYDCQTSAGLRPAGPRPPKPTAAAPSPTASGGSDVPKEAIVLEQTISSDLRAVDIRYSNENMTEADLAYIMSKFEAANGKWAYELEIEYVSMPWLRKGNVLSITGLKAENGTTDIPLQPALVTDQRLQYLEGENPVMISLLTARYWT